MVDGFNKFFVSVRPELTARTGRKRKLKKRNKTKTVIRPVRNKKSNKTKKKRQKETRLSIVIMRIKI